MKEKVWTFLKSQPVMLIAFGAAVLTALLVPPDAGYLEYCNATVLIELFALMAAVCGLRSAGLFETATQVLLKKSGSVRRLGLIFVLMCFISAMFVTNDVALLTFVPLTLLVWENIRDEETRIFTIVLETAAANLGSMLTPIGNPQNLYLYEKFHLTVLDFLRIMLPTGLLGLACILLLCLRLPKTRCTAPERDVPPIHKVKAIAFGVLFVLCLLAVLHKLPVLVLLAASVLIAAVFDWKTLLKIDYGLLVTFVCFFVFVGNIGRMEAVRNFFSAILTGRELLVGALLSQAISNVPASMMLSEFTKNGGALLLGVDIGGFGTLIGSLASLISFQIYRRVSDAQTGRFIAVFSVVNFGLLILLLAAAHLFPTV